jgi:hypothetical protein
LEARPLQLLHGFLTAASFFKNELDFGRIRQLLAQQHPVSRLGIDNQDPQLGISGFVHTLSPAGKWRPTAIHAVSA